MFLKGGSQRKVEGLERIANRSWGRVSFTNFVFKD